MKSKPKVVYQTIEAPPTAVNANYEAELASLKAQQAAMAKADPAAYKDNTTAGSTTTAGKSQSARQSFNVIPRIGAGVSNTGKASLLGGVK